MKAKAAAQAERCESRTPRAEKQPSTSDGETEGESKTPTKDQPNPEPVIAPKLKAELKPLVEELRKIDSLSVLSDAVCGTVVNAYSDVSCCSWSYLHACIWCRFVTPFSCLGYERQEACGWKIHGTRRIIPCIAGDMLLAARGVF